MKNIYFTEKFKCLIVVLMFKIVDLNTKRKPVLNYTEKHDSIKKCNRPV